MDDESQSIRQSIVNLQLLETPNRLLHGFPISSQSLRQTPSFDQKPGHLQPHPEKFSRSDLSLCPQFRSILEAKLQIDAKEIGNEAETVLYGFGRLTQLLDESIHG
ncbi:hypothetical protein Golomagni_05602 [Golovinomyces magnicellulatus]|nr:hypothetical protein Golomagni_05602 [Golovinomyces magnicellulatus]